MTCQEEAAESAEEILQKASNAIGQGKSKQAAELLTAAIKQDDKLSVAYYLRGRERFRLGKIKESVADFDKYVELEPRVASRQWERGIALYYAKKFKEGAKQFELYQTYHDNDVENSVWRYLCVARTDGVEKARATILPIKNDRRVPMMQVFDMFRGKLTPEDVLKKCSEDNPPKDVLDERLFYARLYVGLFYEAAGKKDLAKKYVLMSADKHKDTQRVNRYMWDVARIHADLLRK